MLPLLPIIMAVASLGLGVAQGISSVSQSNEQADAVEAQNAAAVTERARQAKKLISQQKTSFLKSGVYFDGTPQAIFDETYQTAAKDIQAMDNDSNNKQALLKRQGKTAFYSSLLNGTLGAATSFVGLGGTGSALSSAASSVSGKVMGTETGNNIYNYIQKVKGLNVGGFNGGSSGILNA